MADRNGGTNENENRKRLDRMEDVIQNLIALTLEQRKTSEEQSKKSDRQHRQAMEEMAELREHHRAFVKTLREQHIFFMEEAQGLLELQKEHRIDIMALFQSQKNLRESK